MSAFEIGWPQSGCTLCTLYYSTLTLTCWQPASPQQTAGLAPRRSWCNQAGLVFRPSGLFTFSFIGAATRRSQNRYPTWQEVFARPGPAAPSQVPQTRYLSRQQALPQRFDLWPLLLTSWGQSSGGALWTPAYSSGNGQTSWVYSSNPALHMYISCYVTVNKPVLSYLLLCLLPHICTFHI
jgi:hypothetical protein